VQLVEDLAHQAVVELLGASGLVDLVIPRGGERLMSLVDAHARVPVIRHGQGICHVYVDAEADASMGAEIAFNAKVQRPGVCNAMETLLVHRAALDAVLSRLGPRLAEKGVEIRADEEARRALGKVGVSAALVAAKDYDTEFLDLILAVRTVGGLDEALEHIADHGSHHTASIVTRNAASAERFLNEVDASCVLWNASTRFNDGGELGLGAEMGISTSKMHAYGPMSVNELTAEKLVVLGEGQVRS
jgi:glutamate-5-semialdehyde dehydrogenase